VWIYALGGTSAMRRLTFGGRNRLPVWSPDGQRVVFQSDREGSVAIFLQRVDGTGGVERLTTPDKDDVHIPESWSPDARHLTFSAVKGGVFSLWVLALADGKITPFGDVRSVEPIGSVFSPDGRWIAYHARSPGAEQLSPNAGVFVEPFPASGTGARNQAPRVAFDFQPLWSRTGKELFYVPTTASGRLAAVRIATETGLTFGIPESLPFTLTAGRTSGATRAFDVLSDGRFVGLVAGSGEGPSREIRLVFNWTEELKRLVPTR